MQRIDTISPAFLIGFVAFAVRPSETVLVTWTLGAWAVLTAMAILVIVLNRLPRGTPSIGSPDSSETSSDRIRERVVDALAQKAELLRKSGRIDEALSAYDDLIRNGLRRI